MKHLTRSMSGVMMMMVLLAALPAVAIANGTIQQLSGTITVQKADGGVRVLARQSQVVSGDTLNTERDSYAQVKFSDGAVMTLKPNTRIKIEDYAFDQAQPARDNSAFALLKGGLRMITGLVGKRGNQDALRMSTVTATVGIRGTTFTVDDCVTTACVKRSATRVSRFGANEYASLDGGTRIDFADASTDPSNFESWVERERSLNRSPQNSFPLLGERVAQAQSGCDAANAADCLTPAVYVGVSDGEIIVANSAGTINFSAGQFGSVQNFNSRPVTLPGDPGLPIFQPPATFFQNISGGGVGARSAQCIAN